MLDLRRPRDRQDHRGAVEQPGERDLARRRVWCSARLGERRALLGELAGREREPGDEADALALAEVDDLVGVAVGDVVAVLHRRHRDASRDPLDLLDRYLGEAEVADLALVACASATTSSWSSSGIASSIRCSCQRSIRSTRRRSRLPSISRRRTSGSPLTGHSRGPVRSRPPLRRDHEVVRVGVEGLGRSAARRRCGPYASARVDQVDASGCSDRPRAAGRRRRRDSSPRLGRGDVARRSPLAGPRLGTAAQRLQTPRRRSRPAVIIRTDKRGDGSPASRSSQASEHLRRRGDAVAPVSRSALAAWCQTVGRGTPTSHRRRG